MLINIELTHMKNVVWCVVERVAARQVPIHHLKTAKVQSKTGTVTKQWVNSMSQWNLDKTMLDAVFSSKTRAWSCVL